MSSSTETALAAAKKKYEIARKALERAHRTLDREFLRWEKAHGEYRNAQHDAFARRKGDF